MVTRPDDGGDGLVEVGFVGRDADRRIHVTQREKRRRGLETIGVESRMRPGKKFKNKLI